MSDRLVRMLRDLKAGRGRLRRATEQEQQMRVKADMAVEAEVVHGAESWQFFAFVFAAVLSIAYAAIDDIAERRWLRMPCVVGYFTLVDLRGRNKLVRLLGRFKKERSW